MAGRPLSERTSVTTPTDGSGTATPNLLTAPQSNNSSSTILIRRGQRRHERVLSGEVSPDAPEPPSPERLRLQLGSTSADAVSSIRPVSRPPQAGPLTADPDESDEVAGITVTPPTNNSGSGSRSINNNNNSARSGGGDQPPSTRLPPGLPPRSPLVSGGGPPSPPAANAELGSTVGPRMPRPTSSGPSSGGSNTATSPPPPSGATAAGSSAPQVSQGTSSGGAANARLPAMRPQHWHVLSVSDMGSDDGVAAAVAGLAAGGAAAPETPTGRVRLNDTRTSVILPQLLGGVEHPPAEAPPGGDDARRAADGPATAAARPPPTVGFRAAKRDAAVQTAPLRSGYLARRGLMPLAPVIMMLVAPLILLSAGISYAHYWRAVYAVVPSSEVPIATTAYVGALFLGFIIVNVVVLPLSAKVLATETPRKAQKQYIALSGLIYGFFVALPLGACEMALIEDSRANAAALNLTEEKQASVFAAITIVTTGVFFVWLAYVNFVVDWIHRTVRRRAMKLLRQEGVHAVRMRPGSQIPSVTKYAIAVSARRRAQKPVFQADDDEAHGVPMRTARGTDGDRGTVSRNLVFASPAPTAREISIF